METAYFRTFDPHQKSYLTRLGRWIAWNYVDEQTGLLVTNNAVAITDLRSLAKRNSGAIVEISASQYAALEAKKKDPRQQPKRWREEFQVVRKMGQTSTPPPLNLGKNANRAATEPEQPNAVNRTPLPDGMRPKATR